MSFRCGSCKEAVGRRTQVVRVVIERRAKTYAARWNDRGDRIDEGGEGYETVRELWVGPCCAKKYEKTEPVMPAKRTTPLTERMPPWTPPNS